MKTVTANWKGLWLFPSSFLQVNEKQIWRNCIVYHHFLFMSVNNPLPLQESRPTEKILWLAQSHPNTHLILQFLLQRATALLKFLLQWAKFLLQWATALLKKALAFNKKTKKKKWGRNAY